MGTVTQQLTVFLFFPLCPWAPNSSGSSRVSQENIHQFIQGPPGCPRETYTSLYRVRQGVLGKHTLVFTGSSSVSQENTLVYTGSYRVSQGNIYRFIHGPPACPRKTYTSFYRVLQRVLGKHTLVFTRSSSVSQENIHQFIQDTLARVLGKHTLVYTRSYRVSQVNIHQFIQGPPACPRKTYTSLYRVLQDFLGKYILV